MTSTETRWRRLIVRWTGRKGFAAMILFFVLSLIIQVLLVYYFQMLGLVDRNVWTPTTVVPYANWTLSVSVSPLFHLLPIGVLVVLLSSWTYLTKYTAFVPQRMEAARRVSTPIRPGQESRRFRSLRRFYKRFSRRLERIGRAFKAGAQRIRGISYISQRLSFARAAVKSAVVVLVIFLSIFFLLFLWEYPDSIHESVLNLYRGSPAFLNFVKGTGQWLQGVGQALPPLGGLGSAINNALVASGPGLRHSLAGFVESLVKPVVQLDVESKYVLSQNLAAWASALVAVTYGVYASSRTRRPRAR